MPQDTILVLNTVDDNLLDTRFENIFRKFPDYVFAPNFIVEYKFNMSPEECDLLEDLLIKYLSDFLKIGRVRIDKNFNEIEVTDQIIRIFYNIKNYIDISKNFSKIDELDKLSSKIFKKRILFIDQIGKGYLLKKKKRKTDPNIIFSPIDISIGTIHSFIDYIE